MQHPQVKAFFDENTNTFSYVVTDPETKVCAVIDSVLDYDAASASTSTHSADQIIDFVKTHQLKVEWKLLEEACKGFCILKARFHLPLLLLYNHLQYAAPQQQSLQTLYQLLPLSVFQ